MLRGRSMSGDLGKEERHECSGVWGMLEQRGQRKERHGVIRVIENWRFQRTRLEGRVGEKKLN